MRIMDQEQEPTVDLGIRPRPDRRRIAIVVAGWLAAAVVATLVGLGGIRLVGESLTSAPGGVLSQEDVAEALDEPARPGSDPTDPISPRESASAGTGPNPDGTASPGADPGAGTGTSSGDPAATSNGAGNPAPTRGSGPGGNPATRKVFSTEGGTVTAACEPTGEARLISWSPKQGYQVTDHDRGPDDEVEVRFESDGRRIELKIHCESGTPVPERKDDHRGSDDD